ncbi:MAG: hypothetical protein Q9211_000692 [Gyalolechia sp. 1 TL-2023]
MRRRRRDLKQKGLMSCRKPPTAQEYFDYQQADGVVALVASGGLYHCYILKAFGRIDGQPFKVGAGLVKSWSGDPMAAIDKAFGALMRDSRRIPRELQDLNNLYQDDDLELEALEESLRASRKPRNPDGRPGDDDESDRRGAQSRDSSPDESGDHKEPKAPKARQSARIQKQGQWQKGKRNDRAKRHLEQHQQPLIELVTSRKPRAKLQHIPFARPSTSKRVKIEADQLYKWGPECTTQDMIRTAITKTSPSLFGKASKKTVGKYEGKTKVEHGMLSPRLSGGF